MSRYRRYGELDTPPTETRLGESGWIGVNMRVDPDRVPPGFASFARNIRFRDGVPETRLGMQMTPWWNKVTASVPNRWTTIYGVSDPLKDNAGTSYNLLAADGAVYAIIEAVVPQSIPLPAGVTVTGTVTFTQCGPTVVMFRGASLPPLQMQNTTEGFIPIPGVDVADGSVPVPPAERGVFIADRLVVPFNRDYLWISDVFDVSRGDFLNQVRIGRGDGGAITALRKYNDTTLIVFMQRAVHALLNFYGNLQSVIRDEVTDQYGCTAPESVVRAGNELFWWGQPGVCSLRQTSTNKVQAVNVPFSYDLQPLVDRVNRQYETGITARWVNSRLYVAVPLDDGDVQGSNMVPTGGAVTAPVFNVLTTVGRTYKWVKGAVGENVKDGASGVEFDYSAKYVATEAFATVFTVDSTMHGELYEVTKGVNNAVLVYDFLSTSRRRRVGDEVETEEEERVLRVGAWSGYDESDGVAFARFFTAPHRGQERLFTARHDGWVCLYDEDFLDFAPPYTDVVVVTAPANGNTVAVNAAGTITAATGSAANGAASWGASTLTFARANLWIDAALGYGYSPYALSGVWAATNTSPFPIANGVRFYSTNGAVPTVAYTGTWATVTQNNRQWIPCEIITRGLSVEGGALLRPKIATFDLQTWAPSFTPGLLTEGVGEEYDMASAAVTRSRTAYATLDPAWVATNANDDFLTAKREDYSVLITAAAGIQHGDDGVSYGLHQDARFPYTVSGPTPARSLRLKLASTQGRFRLMSAELEASRETNTPITTL
jgi:hypothetical protein